MNYEALERIMAEKEISRRKLSQLLGLSPNALTYAINEESQKGIINTPATIQKIASILGCEVSELLDGLQIDFQKEGDVMMPRTCVDALIEENYELKKRVYNMNLYINWLEENYPATFKAMEDRFSGLPGYNEDICWVEIERNEGDWDRW